MVLGGVFIQEDVGRCNGAQCMSNLHPILKTVSGKPLLSGPTLILVFCNSRSVTNKIPRISGLLCEEQIDLACLTEMIFLMWSH